MPYMEFNGEVKKVNLKPNGDKEITLVVPREQLRGKLDSLDDILGGKTAISFDSLVVNYTIEINAHTEKPLKTYKVDDKGFVSEVKPEGEQLEANLGLPEAKIPTKEEKEQAEREIIDEFILSGLAPSYDDLPYDFANIVKRRLEGETYMKLSSELGISSGKIVELIDEYRKRLAPLATKWDEWRQEKEQPKKEANEEPEVKAEGEEESDKSGQEDENVDSNEQEDTESPDNAGQEPSEEEIEEFILGGHAPKFPDIQFDFLELLHKKKSMGSWTKVATHFGISIGKLRRDYNTYKERVAKQMRGEDIA